MAVYEYKGIGSEGEGMSGVVEADSPRLARMKLRETGIFTMDLVAVEEAASSLRPPTVSPLKVSLADTAVMTRQLATLVKAGSPLMEALTALVEQAEKPVAQKVWTAVREGVREGASFADALGQYPKTFSPLYQQMVQAGEASGTLDLMLLRLAQYLEDQQALRHKLLSILAYPLLVLILSGIILLFLIAFVVPRVTTIFADLHRSLPWPTVLLLALSHFLQRYGPFLLLLALVGAIGLKRLIETPKGEWQYDRLKLKLPLFGRLFKILAVSRFAKTLATLLVGGVPLLLALAIVEQIVGNKILQEAIGKVRENIRQGEGIARPMKASGVFPPLLIHLIAVGEKSGELEPMLEKIAESYEREVETTITSLVSLLGPLMILAMGGIVLFIVLAILLPIFDLSQIVR